MKLALGGKDLGQLAARRRQRPGVESTDAGDDIAIPIGGAPIGAATGRRLIGGDSR